MKAFISGFVFFYVSLALLFCGCTTSKSKYDETKSTLSSAEQKKLDEYRAEIEMGRNMSGRLLQFYGNQDNDKLLNYVNQVGAYVASYSDHPERRYMFEIVNSDAANAFASPGGYILITMGALRNAENEAELAGVLGHEIAHVAHKHIFNKVKSMSEKEVNEADQAANKKLTLPESVLVRERPKAEDSAFNAALAKYLAGQMAGLNILKAAGAGMNVLLESGLSPELELEADSYGVKYASNAGYDPYGLRTYLCRLQMKKLGSTSGKCDLAKVEAAENPSGKKESILEKTHPPISERIKNINKVLAEIDAKQIVGATGENRFLKYHKELPPPKEKIADRIAEQ